MTPQTETHSRIAQQANRCLNEYEFRQLPIDPFELCAKIGIDLIPKPPTEEGVSGMLIRHGNNFGIVYATNIPSEGFQRFSVAHELGHYFLDGHPEKIFDTTGIHRSRAGFASSDPYEREADCFASNLLMPARLVRPLLRTIPDSIRGVASLAKTCKTSLTATAIRVAELADTPIAVIISSRGIVDYCRCSEELRKIKGWNALTKGSPLPASVSRDLARSDSSALERSGATAFSAWFGGRIDTELREETMHLSSYDKQLTLLFGATVSDEDEDDEDAIREQWLPRFKK